MNFVAVIPDVFQGQIANVSSCESYGGERAALHQELPNQIEPETSGARDLHHYDVACRSTDETKQFHAVRGFTRHSKTSARREHPPDARLDNRVRVGCQYPNHRRLKGYYTNNQSLEANRQDYNIRGLPREWHSDRVISAYKSERVMWPFWLAQTQPKVPTTNQARGR
jgi:hypothetical protein